MIRAVALLTLAVLAGCVSNTAPVQTSAAFRATASERIQFALEAVCLNNTTRAAQNRAARSLGFPIAEREGASTVYVNPTTLTFLRIGPAPDQFITTEAGRLAYRGSGCSVGSPAVGIQGANAISGRVLAARLADGTDLLNRPVSAGTNELGGAGFFFEDLSVTLPIADTTFTNEQTGESETISHPVILIIHR
ncbi:hypothetical protein [Jannaschia sp. M317]|uniref:hypothetical protein n=1 Tax=Jannaschia sp. M317 TaxID=2867011 RepID=UPI0021A42F7B|nr:hypothetical protein [Jannaschia sp. M317]UWQ18027.1 hypothetical protein K3551_01595 [Jannaschia sp. M317]